MQFYDKVTVEVKSGKWGDGCVSGRRETGVPHGWPSGWNGGKGWSVILQADENIHTLIDYKYIKHYKAPSGEPGRSKEQYGANADDLILKVPVSTLVSREWRVLHYFSHHQEKFIVARGWDGGLGNMEFTTSILQYPQFALLWELEHGYDITLELQLLGDVALIGMPSVGKSTLINAIAKTKAKVADYHFTTLVPHLGSVKVNDFSYNVVDVPGLIKWAAQWKWLGNAFLRHILKSQIFCMMADLYSYEQGIQDIEDLLNELLMYIQAKVKDRSTKQKDFDPSRQEIEIFVQIRGWLIILCVSYNNEIVLEKEINFVANKHDLVNDDEIVGEYIDQLIIKLKDFTYENKKLFADVPQEILMKNIFIISAATHHNLPNLTKFRADQLEHLKLKTLSREAQEKVFSESIQEKKLIIKDITYIEKPKLIEDSYIEEFAAQYLQVRYLDHPKVCKLVYTTQRWNDQAEMRFRSKLDTEWYLSIMEKAGVRKWDILKIKSHYEGYEDRFIQW